MELLAQDIEENPSLDVPQAGGESDITKCLKTMGALKETVNNDANMIKALRTRCKRPTRKWAGSATRFYLRPFLERRKQQVKIVDKNDGYRVTDLDHCTSTILPNDLVLLFHRGGNHSEDHYDAILRV